MSVNPAWLLEGLFGFPRFINSRISSPPDPREAGAPAWLAEHAAIPGHLDVGPLVFRPRSG